jgi:hypothetical protein
LDSGIREPASALQREFKRLAKAANEYVQKSRCRNRVVMGLIWMQAGCAEVVVLGTLAGAGEYYPYNTSNVAKKTLMDYSQSFSCE